MVELHGGYRHQASLETGIPVEQWIDFSANINPLGIPKGLKQVMKQEIEALIHYPDPNCLELTKALAQWEEVEETRIFCGNGGADVLYRYLTALSPKKVCIPVPTFVEYEEVLKNHWNHQYEVIWKDKTDQEHDREQEKGEKPELILYRMEQSENFVLTEQFLDCLDESYDLIILCSPNNPTGKVISTPLLQKVIKRAKECHSKVLLDLSFLDFVSERDFSYEKELKKEEHVTILHSFTKMYGIPGIRLGYAILENGMTKEEMQRHGASWSVNHLAQKVGIAALREEEFVKKTLIYIKEERKFLIGELEKRGFFVVHGEANYIFFQKKGDTTLHERLKQKGILIRSCQNYRGLSSDYYRIGIKTRKENERLLNVLREEL